MTTLLMEAWAVLRAGEHDGLAEALSACVRVKGEVVHASLHGTVRDETDQHPLRRGDLFDVGALTQVLATAGVAASLAAEGRLDLDAPVAGVLPDFAQSGKGAVTFRHLLAHTSGLPARCPWFEAAARDPLAGLAFLAPGERPGRAALRDAFVRGHELVAAAAMAEPLQGPPGAVARPGEAGFVALGLALEALGGAPLAALAEARIFGPLGLRSTFFVDHRDLDAAAARAAGRLFLATGQRPSRHEPARGAVHDDTAWAMGGVAGHAGLFSTAEDVAAIGQAWLDALLGREAVVPSSEALAFARPDPTPGSDRALGWVLPGDRSALGERLGHGGRGALGAIAETGCSLWLDLDAQLVSALLTNHTHPSGAPDRARLDRFRRRFHEAVGDALGA